MIYKNVDAYSMKCDLIACNRDYFSLEALQAYEDFCEGLDMNIEWDPIGFCCEWTEASWDDIDKNYDILIDEEREEESENDLIAAVKDYLNDHTLYFPLSNGKFLYQVF